MQTHNARQEQHLTRGQRGRERGGEVLLSAMLPVPVCIVRGVRVRVWVRLRGLLVRARVARF